MGMGFSHMYENFIHKNENSKYASSSMEPGH